MSELESASSFGARPGAGRARWLAAGLLAGFGAAALGGCLDMALVSGIVFPPTVPGLPAGSYTSFPVGLWVTEGGIEARGIAACLAPGCEPALAAGLFLARGPDAARLARIADDPEGLVRALRGGRSGKSPAAGTIVSAERIRENGWRGFALRMARTDGTGAAFGTVLVRPAGGNLSAILVVAASAEATRRVTRDIAAAAG